MRLKLCDCLPAHMVILKSSPFTTDAMRTPCFVGSTSQSEFLTGSGINLSRQASRQKPALLSAFSRASRICSLLTSARFSEKYVRTGSIFCPFQQGWRLTSKLFLMTFVAPIAFPIAASGTGEPFARFFKFLPDTESKH